VKFLFNFPKRNIGKIRAFPIADFSLAVLRYSRRVKNDNSASFFSGSGGRCCKNSAYSASVFPSTLVKAALRQGIKSLRILVYIPTGENYKNAAAD